MSFDRVQDIIPVDHIFVVTNALYAPLVKKQLPMLPEENILLEPARRNTAPCIAWAAYHIAAINPDASIMVAPSDHIILRETEFRKSVIKGFEFVEQHDALLTMGVKPSRPETGYGYIQIGKEQVPGISPISNSQRCFSTPVSFSGTPASSSGRLRLSKMLSPSIARMSPRFSTKAQACLVHPANSASSPTSFKTAPTSLSTMP